MPPVAARLLAVLLTAGAVVLGYAYVTLSQGGGDDVAGGGPVADVPRGAHPGEQLLRNPLPNPAATGVHGALLDEPIPRPAFTLTDTDGEPFAFAEATAGRPTLLYFGYTSCPDICPAHLARIAAAMREADLDGDDLTVVFVTADPARDDPARLAAYLAAFDTDFVGLTGSSEEVAAALAAVGQPAPRIFDEREDGAYEVSHPSQVIAFTPDDRAHVVFPFGTSHEGWVADLPRLVQGELPS